ncbi:MAG: cytochrome P450, partial [Venatoribacter sp.]
DELAYQSLSGPQTELMADFAEPMAARLQCAFMGWPQELADTLLSWQKRNSQAVFAADRAALSALAKEFERLIAQQLEMRRQRQASANEDVTSRLLHEKVNGKAMSDEEIASILRNWTVGEVGTIAASIGIIAQFLAANPNLQSRIRQRPELLWQANDEILRLYNPLTDNRRRTTCPVQLSGKDIGTNQRIVINWVAANRDPEAFERADEFVLERDQSENLLYGAGLHVCPGEGLAKMELVVIMRAVLQHTEHLAFVENKKAEYAKYPASGYAKLPLALR